MECAHYTNYKTFARVSSVTYQGFLFPLQGGGCFTAVNSRSQRCRWLFSLFYTVTPTGHVLWAELCLQETENVNAAAQEIPAQSIKGKTQVRFAMKGAIMFLVLDLVILKKNSIL